MGNTECCKYNDQKIMGGEKIYDFDSCAMVKCQHTKSGGYEIFHEVLFPNGCCNINGKMVPEGELHGDLMCHHTNVYKKINSTQSTTKITLEESTTNKDVR